VKSIIRQRKAEIFLGLPLEAKVTGVFRVFFLVLVMRASIVAGGSSLGYSFSYGYNA